MQHKYPDKYALADAMTNTALAADLNVFELLGLTPASLRKLKDASATRSITLRLKAEETCEFVRERKFDVESATRHETEYSSGVVGAVSSVFKRTDRSVTTVTEYDWLFSASWELFAFVGSSETEKTVLQERQRVAFELINSNRDSPPKPKVSVVPSIDVNITWLLQNVDARTGALVFAINRAAPNCHTPRRNANVDAAIRFFAELSSWARQVHAYFTGRLWPVQPRQSEIDLKIVNDTGLFVPVVPLFEVLSDKANVPALTDSALSSASAAPAGAEVRERGRRRERGRGEAAAAGGRRPQLHDSGTV